MLKDDMRFRRRYLIVIGCLLLAGVIAYKVGVSSSNAEPKLVIAVTDQQSADDSVVVFVTASNAGPRTLADGGSCKARFEVGGVWTTNSFGGAPSSIFWLLPGETRRQKLSIPRKANRFQVGYSFEVASPRVSLACRLAEHGWLDRFRWALRVLPSPTAEYRDFWGPEYQVAPRPN